MSDTSEQRILQDANRLIGLTITGVRHMTPEEKAALIIPHRAIVLILSDGSLLYPMADDEGNDAGVLIAKTRDGQETHLSSLPQ